MPTVVISSQQVKTLAIASNFAHHIWQNKQSICKKFLGSYPLQSTLSNQNINDLIQDYTVDENYQLADEATIMSGLRQLRNLLMFRWIWQDSLGLISVEQLTDELSEFADGCIRFAKSYTFNALTQLYGRPSYKIKNFDDSYTQHWDDMAIFAMGKLGAKELNLSSDIDLIFVHTSRGKTDITSFDRAKCIDNQRFMLRLGQGIIKLLDTKTADGFVFRVDMRLRPWGDGSDLAIHTTALEKYFTQHGRAWERFAWLKARVVNPVDVMFTDNLSNIVNPFVFRNYVDYSAFSSLREMRSMITSQIAQREDLTNIKLGAGGIRDIEFIVQAYQLIYGGRDQLLQVKPCLEAMKYLQHSNHFDETTYNVLQSAYLFLRRLEHAIQAINDQQTQRLPIEIDIQQRLAITLGFNDWQALLDTLNQHRKEVSVPFNALVTDRQADIAQDEEELADITNQLKAILNKDNLKLREQFWNSKLITNLSEEARERLDNVFPLMAEATIKHEHTTGESNIAFPRLITLLEAICRRSIYLVMLAENPQAAIDLIPMLSSSPWIANELARYPVLLDTFLQQKYYHLPDKVELRDIMRQRLLRVEPTDEENLLSTLRLFKKIQVLAVAGSEILAERPIMKVSDSLTFIAEIVVEASLQRAFSEVVRRHGYPIGKNNEPVTEAYCGFAIIGYGKLGGIELSYSSDLDLVFLHHIKEKSMTTGEKSISGMKFAQRLAQKLMTYLTSVTQDGYCYEIDMRLRPSGNAGMMVVSDTSFEKYQLEKAWNWEHQALVRARAVCGDKSVIQKFNEIRHKVLSLPRELTDIQDEVIKMRLKMRNQLGSNNQTQQAGKFNLKQDTGGLVDIEFIAQFGVLAYANRLPRLTEWSDNVRIFESLAAQGVWDKQTCDDLTQAYLKIRTHTHYLALAQRKILVDEAAWNTIRKMVKKYWAELVEGVNRKTNKNH